MIRLNPFTPQAASELERLLEQLEPLLNLSAVPPFHFIRDPGGVILNYERDHFWIQITSAATGTAYAWIERLRVNATTWIDKPGGMTGTVSAMPAVEVNGNTSVPLNTNVRAWMAESANHVLFHHPAGGGSLIPSVVFTTYQVAGDFAHTTTAGMYAMLIRGAGAGGGGGGCSDTGSGGTAAAGGGGGGAYFEVHTTYPHTNPPYTIDLTVGAGGAGGVAASDGSDGGDTIWDTPGGGLNSAGGGGKGGKWCASSTTPLVTAGGGGGVAGGTTSFNQDGGFGQPGLVLSSSVGVGGAGGKCGGMPGGSGTYSLFTGDGTNGNNLISSEASGGGGSGALSADSSDQTGSDGADGWIVVIEWCFS